MIFESQQFNVNKSDRCLLSKYIYQEQREFIGISTTHPSVDSNKLQVHTRPHYLTPLPGCAHARRTSVWKIEDLQLI